MMWLRTCNLVLPELPGFRKSFSGSCSLFLSSHNISLLNEKQTVEEERLQRCLLLNLPRRRYRTLISDISLLRQRRHVRSSRSVFLRSNRSSSLNCIVPDSSLTGLTHETVLSNKLLLQLHQDVDRASYSTNGRRKDLPDETLKAKGSGLESDSKSRLNSESAQKTYATRKNVLTVPNALCVARIAMSPYIGYLVVLQQYNLALGLVCVAGVTDLLDGYIARRFPSQQSVLGSMLDPLADKFLVSTLFVTLTYSGLIPVPLTALILFRDVCLIAGSAVIRYKTLPEPRTLNRYFDTDVLSAQMNPTTISKMNTGVQLGLVAITLTAPVFGFVDHVFLHALWYVTAASTLLSGFSYIWSKDIIILPPATKPPPPQKPL